MSIAQGIVIAAAITRKWERTARTMPDRHFRWKLIFRCSEVRPGQITTCQVQSAYHFRGVCLTLEKPHCFQIERLRVGIRDQLHQPVAACLIANLLIDLDTAVKGVWHEIRVKNITDQPQPFLAELHGSILADEHAKLGAQDWEGPSTLLFGNYA